MRVEELFENSCCRCLRQADEHESGSCDAIFSENGDMLKKCSHCAGLRADCESVCKHIQSMTIGHSPKSFERIYYISLSHEPSWSHADVFIKSEQVDARAATTGSSTGA